MDAFTKALKEHRRRKLMTQAEYAAHIGVSHGAIMGWEQGVRTPSMSMARKLIDDGMSRILVTETVAQAATGRAA